MFRLLMGLVKAATWLKTEKFTNMTSLDDRKFIYNIYNIDLETRKIQGNVHNFSFYILPSSQCFRRV